MKSILDPTFKYYSSVDTDLRRTFQRIREEARRASITRSERRQPDPPKKIASMGAPRLLRMADRHTASPTAALTEVVSEP